MNIFEAIKKTDMAAPYHYALYVKEADDGLLRWYEKATNKKGNIVSWYWIKCKSWCPYAK